MHFQALCLLFLKNNFYLFLQHDAHNEIITVKKTEKGIRLKNIYNSQEIFN